MFTVMVNFTVTLVWLVWCEYVCIVCCWLQTVNCCVGQLQVFHDLWRWCIACVKLFYVLCVVWNTSRGPTSDQELDVKWITLMMCVIWQWLKRTLIIIVTAWACIESLHWAVSCGSIDSYYYLVGQNLPKSTSRLSLKCVSSCLPKVQLVAKVTWLIACLLCDID